MKVGSAGVNLARNILDFTTQLIMLFMSFLRYWLFLAKFQATNCFSANILKAFILSLFIDQFRKSLSVGGELCYSTKRLSIFLHVSSSWCRCCVVTSHRRKMKNHINDIKQIFWSRAHKNKKPEGKGSQEAIFHILFAFHSYDLLFYWMPSMMESWLKNDLLRIFCNNW